jgi:hypothetical protein
MNAPGPSAEIHPPAINGKRAGFKLPRYDLLYRVIHGFDWPIVGIDFVLHQLQADGRSPPEWRTYAAGLAGHVPGSGVAAGS